MRVDADGKPRGLSPADHRQVAACFPAPRFRVAIEGVGAYRIRDYATPSHPAMYTACTAYDGSPRDTWERVTVDCARLNSGDLAPSPAWYRPCVRPALTLAWSWLRRRRRAVRPSPRPSPEHLAPQHLRTG